MMAVWRVIPPDSLVIEFVPPRASIMFAGIRINARMHGDSIIGTAQYWSDALGADEPRAAIVGASVRCPAGA